MKVIVKLMQGDKVIRTEEREVSDAASLRQAYKDLRDEYLKENLEVTGFDIWVALDTSLGR